MKKFIKNLLFSKVGIWAQKQYRKFKFFKPVIVEQTDNLCARPFNYYESPYPDMIEIHKHEKEIFDRNKEVKDIDFNLDRQLELIREMESIPLPKWPLSPSDGIYRYYYDNNWFRKGCADALYYMIRIVKPKKIIEIGSGFSTSVMLDTNENYFNNGIKIISIEPRADRLRTLLRPDDNLEIYEKDLQEIPLEFFEILNENDILFIDSSHVSKINSDVNYLFFEVLPRLKNNILYIFMICFIRSSILPNGYMREGHIMKCIY